MSANSPIKTRVSGVVFIDKPMGITSQQVVSKVKYLLQSPIHNSKKAGHTGTLDPMATGLLPVCLGEATKFSHYQLEADKSYEATIKLGEQTDTGDADGQIIATKPVPSLQPYQLERVAKQFTGEIMQIPPMYSALKKNGKKLYEYAREGIEVARDARPLNIKALTLTLGDREDALYLSVTCSKGTYVRVLGEDIAMALGTLGHLTALRRTQVGQFDIKDSIGLEDFAALSHTERLLQLGGIDACIEDLPKLIVSLEDCQRLHLGQRLNVSELITSQPYLNLYRSLQSLNETETIDVRLFGDKEMFLGLGALAASGRLQPKKMIQR